MKQDVEIMPSRPAAPDPAPAVAGPRALRSVHDRLLAHGSPPPRLLRTLLAG
jgi:hypothetical protein